MLEATMSKRRNLQIYLNVVEWGENVFVPTPLRAITSASPPPHSFGAGGPLGSDASPPPLLRPQPRIALSDQLQRQHPVQMDAAQIP